jgi:hypothetical protein
VTGPHDEPPDLSSYVGLLDQFLATAVDARTFRSAYLRLFLGDARLFGDPWYSVLNDLFYACEDYVPQPELRTDPGDLDDAQLLDAARTARGRLAALGV